MKSVLFICTANICRSPLAAGLLRARKDVDPTEWRIESAGTWAVEGAPAATHTMQVLRERGVNISRHIARSVTRELLRSFNLILVMQQSHKEALAVEFPELRDRVYLLSEMVGEHKDIQDPIGGPLPHFQKTAVEIERIFDRGFERISHLAEDNRHGR